MKGSKDAHDAEIARLTKEVAELKASVERTRAFFSDITRAEDLVGFLIEPCTSDLSGEQLGRLVFSFNERFAFALFVQPYASNDMREHYRLLAVRDYSTAGVWTGEWERKISRDDEIAMRHFVLGFIAAEESKREKD
jgi:hypothetical protein